jgi:protein-tyrosine phosphatase
LVFICKGNICRSPFAEAVARARGWQTESFGLEVETRQPADEIANKVALMLGVDMTNHMARPISDGTFSAKDCLVAMEPEQLLALRQIKAQWGCEVTLLGDWTTVARKRLPDPYGKGHREMERVLRLIEDGVCGLLSALSRHDRSD